MRLLINFLSSYTEIKVKGQKVRMTKTGVLYFDIKLKVLMKTLIRIKKCESRLQILLFPLLVMIFVISTEQ